MQPGKKRATERGILVIPTIARDFAVAPGAGVGAPAATPPIVPKTPVLDNSVFRPNAGKGVGVRPLLVVLVATTVGGVLIGLTMHSQTVAVQTVVPTQVPEASLTPPPVTKKAVVVPAAPSWGPLTAVPFGRLPANARVTGAFQIGKQLVVIDGGGTGTVFSGRAGSNLPQVAELPNRLIGAAAFAAGNSVLVVGGSQASKPTDQILELRLHTGQLVTGPRFTEPLAEMGVVPQDGFAYLVGGWTGEKYATAVIKFTPPGQATLVARLPAGLRSPAVVLVGRLLYVAGGRTQSGLSRGVYSVDTQSGTVRTLGQLPQAVDRAQLISSGSKLYLLGGRSASGKLLDTIVRIDPLTGKTAAAGRMPRPLAGAATVPFGKSTLVVGAPSGRIYRLDPGTAAGT